MHIKPLNILYIVYFNAGRYPSPRERQHHINDLISLQVLLSQRLTSALCYMHLLHVGPLNGVHDLLSPTGADLAFSVPAS